MSYVRWPLSGVMHMLPLLASYRIIVSNRYVCACMCVRACVRVCMYVLVSLCMSYIMSGLVVIETSI